MYVCGMSITIDTLQIHTYTQQIIATYICSYDCDIKKCMYVTAVKTCIYSIYRACLSTANHINTKKSVICSGSNVSVHLIENC